MMFKTTKIAISNINTSENDNPKTLKKVYFNILNPLLNMSEFPTTSFPEYFIQTVFAVLILFTFNFYGFKPCSIGKAFTI